MRVVAILTPLLNSYVLCSHPNMLDRRRWQKNVILGRQTSPTPLSPQGVFRRRCRMAGRVAYIGGAIILTCAVILEGIFTRILLIPYLNEADFLPTNCVVHDSFYESRAGMQRCEGRCAKLVSAFPCLVVRVQYLRLTDNSWQTGHLFDQLLSYQKRNPYLVGYLSIVHLLIAKIIIHFSNSCIFIVDEFLRFEVIQFSILKGKQIKILGNFFFV